MRPTGLKEGVAVSVLSDDLRTLSYEAAVYFYPLVTMDVTRLHSVNAPADQPIGGPPNQFKHIRAFPTADFRSVVRPNFDTLYSSAWLDLTGGPVQLHVPDTGDRYYLLPLLDMWSDVFAVPGKRTTGTEAQDFVITPPGYGGRLPDGMAVIAAPTSHVWIIGRTQTNGPADYDAVHKVQDGYRIATLGEAQAHSADPNYDASTEPLKVVNGMAPLDYFTYAAQLLATHPPHATDFSQLARLSRLGIVAGKPFDANSFSSQQRSDIEAGWTAALNDMMAALVRQGRTVSGWNMLTDTMGVYGDAYLRRAIVAMIGLGANQPEDAIYPVLTADANGDPITGEHDYVIHFDADNLPPVAAFWSVTMYDAEGFQVANEIDRFAIGDRDALRYNADGSLDLYLQHDNPGAEREDNWLPAPRGPLGITMRLYAPKREALDGTWNPPPVRINSLGHRP
jgi:hypothetical protein